ncbi:IclR family transcriptional regulator [Caballeronia sp. LZ062]|uniref:IclR family transcriptional regulator n=1 Tax=unclassified Caballeronia TaxID=2646786 RepID=UPI002861EC73|nr:MULTISPECIES: IclR family transcriptional regulator [unclassified Caballeronia]MDR5857760.1 IclR family transcriptional regulator [Caballeronia sp. LZ050]MDR5869310.1 IclR family transcriptional regulator [Caballeronia sp. LZ062]
MTATHERPADTSGAVERSLRLLRFIAEGGSTRNISEAARRIGVNRVTLMRLIAVLEQAGMLIADAAGHRLGMPFLTLASAALGSSSLIARAREVLPGLAASTRMSAYLVVREAHEIVYWLAETPDTPLVSQIRVGSRLPAYRATPGLAMLALLDAGEVERMCESSWQEPDAPAFEDLRARLEQIKADGCAWSRSGLEAGIDSCAAPIVSADGRVLAALSVAGPSQMFSHESERSRTLAEQVISAAQQISTLVL